MHRMSLRPAVSLAAKIVGFAGLLVLGALLAGRSSAVPVELPARAVPFHHGIAYVSWWHDFYESSGSDSSLALLAATNADWVSILVTGYQDTETSTSIYQDPQRTPSDAGVLQAIDRAHALGMHVFLKPHVDCQNGAWRGVIEFTNESDWAAWFASYRAFLNHYAELAAAAGVEELCVGCEFCRTVHRSAEWLAVIADVRARFSGPITYAANWDNYTAVTFWDSLDYAGIDGYFELTDLLDPTPAQLLAAWAPWEADVADFAQTSGHSIVFTEIGYRSVDGANIHPWEWTTSGTVDLQEQVDCYEAALQTFCDRDYFRGFFWWDWEPDPDHGGPTDNGYSPHGKPAADVLADWYGVTSVADPGIPRLGGLQWLVPAPLRAGQEIVFRWEAGDRGSRAPGAPGELGIEVYDLQGRGLSRLCPQPRGERCFCVRWPAATDAGLGLSPGAYFLRLCDGEQAYPAMRVLYVGR
ncbi:MAG: hypothetical protein KAY32_07095 [Candidatus Eisenbacteria sp.]|nr:hypothetical protein [Candidatus Eisenbacteria bacterium]